MRIALFSALYPTPRHPRIVGGAEVFARQFAEALVAGGDEVVAMCNSLTGTRESETVNGVRVEFMPVRNLFPPFGGRQNPALRTAWHAIDDRGRAHADIGHVLSQFRPDVVHSNTINGMTADIWRLARERGIRVAHTLHDYYLTCPRCSRYHGGGSCERTCGSCRLLTAERRRRAAAVDAVVGVSRRVLDLHTEAGLFGTAARHVVRNVPNPAIRFTPRPPPEGPLRIGYLGRFSPEKGVGLLVEALALLAPGTAELVLAGNVPDDERARLQGLAAGRAVEFVGFVSPAEFYGTVDLVAMPSLWEEPGALALVDALAAGRPVLGTPFGGIPEVVEDGATGWILTPEPQAWAARLAALAADPGTVAAAQDRLRHLKTRGLADVVNDYRTIYRALAPAA